MIAKLSVCVCVCVGVRVMRGFQVHRNLRFYVSMSVFGCMLEKLKVIELSARQRAYLGQKW